MPRISVHRTMDLKRILTVFWALAATLVAAGAARAQTSADTVVATAVHRRDAGDFAGAATLLRAYVLSHPGDLTAERLLAETQYWAKDIHGARETYEAALRRHPADVRLRLQYGRMLSETNDGSRARDVVTPVLSVNSSRGAAESLLGQVAYWEGDLTGARRLLIAALHDDSSQFEARTQLRELAVTTAPWTSFNPYAQHDDQPLDQIGAVAEAGWFATPLTRLSGRVVPALFRSGDSISVAVLRTELALSTYLPAARLELEAAAGAVQRGGDGRVRATNSSSTRSGTVDWTGHAGVGLRLPGHVTFRLRGKRDSYFYTVASLLTPVMTSTGTALLALNAPSGWLGEIAAQRVWYPDSNAVSTAYGWILVPVVQHAGGQFQIGVAASAQNADQSRFTLAMPVQKYIPGDPRYSTAGYYSPYFTPSDEVTQSVLAAATLHPNAAVTVRMNGSYGVHATRTAPMWQVIDSAGGAIISRASVRQTFSPSSARAALEYTPTQSLVLALTGESFRTAFYTASSVGIQVTYRFTGVALRNVGHY